jgi:hypothetical protein
LPGFSGLTGLNWIRFPFGIVVPSSLFEGLTGLLRAMIQAVFHTARGFLGERHWKPKGLNRKEHRPYGGKKGDGFEWIGSKSGVAIADFGKRTLCVMFGFG